MPIVVPAIAPVMPATSVAPAAVMPTAIAPAAVAPAAVTPATTEVEPLGERELHFAVRRWLQLRLAPKRGGDSLPNVR